MKKRKKKKLKLMPRLGPIFAGRFPGGSHVPKVTYKRRKKVKLTEDQEQIDE